MDEPVYPVELDVPRSVFERLEKYAAEAGHEVEDEILWIISDYAPPD